MERSNVFDPIPFSEMEDAGITFSCIHVCESVASCTKLRKVKFLGAFKATLSGLEVPF